METLFPDNFVRAICRLRISTRPTALAAAPGEHTSRRAGAGMEFRDFRPYGPGDDLRRVDWNVYRRSRRLYLRLAEEPRELPLHVLLDLSDSAFFERPPRADAGRRIAAALMAAALHQHDRAAVYPMGDRLGTPLRPAGRKGFASTLKELAELGPQGKTRLAECVRSFRASRPPAGLVAVVSDFFDPAGLEPLFAELSSLRHRLVLVQLHKASDAAPEMADDVQLIDCESGTAILTGATAREMEQYRAAHAAFEAQLRTFAARRGGLLARIDCDGAIMPQVNELFPGGVLRA